MEKHFLNSALGDKLPDLKHANCDGYMIRETTPGDGTPACELQFYSGNIPLLVFLYDTVDQANNDMILAREVFGNLVNLAPPSPTSSEQQPAAKLPAGAQLDTETPASIKNPQLQVDIAGIADAGLTAYEIGVTADDKYKLSLYRGNSIAFEYLYGTHEDRSNDMMVVLDKLPKLQHIGTPEFIS